MALFGPNIRQLEADENIQGLLAALSHKSPKTRNQVPPALERLGDPRALIPLIEFLERPLDVSQAVEATVDSLISADPLEELLAGLRHDSAHVRDYVAGVLLDRDEPEVIAPFIEALSDPECFTPQQAIPLLARLKKVQAVAPLFDLLAEPGATPKLRAAAMEALDGLQTLWDRKASATLIGLLDHPVTEVRTYAARSLGEIGELEGVAPLLKMVKEGEVELSNVALASLVKLHSHQAVEGLIGTLDHPDPPLRQAIVEALANIGSLEAVEGLITALEDGEHEVRLAAVKALGKGRSQLAIEPLLRLVDASALDIRRHVIAALTVIDDPRVPAGLIKSLSDKDDWIRTQAVKRLSQLHVRESLEPLLEVLGDRVTEVRWRAVEGLGPMMEPKCVEPLIRLLEDDEREVRWRAIETLGRFGDLRAVEPILAALADGDPGIRWRAIEALSALNEPSAIEPLIGCLMDDEEQDNRDASAKALGRFLDPLCVEPLLEAGYPDLAKGLIAQLLSQVQRILRGIDNELKEMDQRQAKGKVEETDPALVSELEQRLRKAQVMAAGAQNSQVMEEVEALAARLEGKDEALRLALETQAKKEEEAKAEKERQKAQELSNQPDQPAPSTE